MCCELTTSVWPPGRAPSGSSALLPAVDPPTCKHAIVRQEFPAFIRWCNVYLQPGSGQAIVADCFNHGGLQAEIAGAARMIDGSDEADLGREVLAALLACRWEPSFNYRDRKRSDWPAYRASGESSIRRFEQGWRQFCVAGANASNIMWELSVLLEEEHQLTMAAVVSRPNDPDGLGRGLRFLEACANSFLDRR
jgi:hypothetical protein